MSSRLPTINVQFICEKNAEIAIMRRKRRSRIYANRMLRETELTYDL